jgi:hypothetical protein
MISNHYSLFRSLIDQVSPFVEIVEKLKTARPAGQTVGFLFVGGTGLESAACSGSEMSQGSQSDIIQVV